MNSEKNEPAPKKATDLGLPLILLGALWSAVSIILTAYKLINDERDEIIHILDCQRFIERAVDTYDELLKKCLECCDPKMHILGPIELYLSNLLPLSVGFCLFLGIIVYSILKMPDYVSPHDPKMRRNVKAISTLTAVLPGLVLFFFILGAFFDAYTILQTYFALP